MSEPSGVLTFESLVERIAREAGVEYCGSSGQEIGMIPADDAHHLNLCKKVVNDGIRMFISDAPPNGWRWMRRIASVTMTVTRITGAVDSVSGTAPGTYTLVDATLETVLDDDGNSLYVDNYFLGHYIYILTGTGIGRYAKITGYAESGGVITVADWLDENGNAIANTGGAVPAATDTFAITPVETIGGDISRYPLPENFGGDAAGRIAYAGNTNHASIIDWCDESFIRAKRAVTIITGYPRHAAIRQFEPVLSAPSAKRRFEIIFDPQPVAADTVEFPYTLYFDNLKLEAGEATNGAATAVSDSSLANIYPDDYFLGWVIKIISGPGKRATGIVTSYVGADGEWFVTDWLYPNGTAAATNPNADSVYVVEPVNNLHPAGYRFDEHILAACLVKAEMEFEDIMANYVQQYHQKSLQGAYVIDARSAPRQLGTMNLGQRYVRERTWRDITHN